MSYNGWSNYQTWLTNLWMDNSEGSQEYYQEIAQECLDEAEGDKQKATRNLAKHLEESHEESMEDLKLSVGVFSDLLSHALGSVDWHEIAESLLEDCEYEGEEEESHAFDHDFNDISIVEGQQ